MYKILIHIDTQSGDKWFYYQENGKDYVTDSLQEIKDTVLTLIDVYGEDYIKIVKQMSGQDMDNADVYLYDSTDNYEELDNRPFINGIEIIGQLSLEDLGIQPIGNYATEEYVDNSIANLDIPEVDLTDYATKEYVDDKNADIDLTKFYTKEEIDETIKKLEAYHNNYARITTSCDLYSQNYIFPHEQERIDLAEAIKKTTKESSQNGYILCEYQSDYMLLMVRRTGTQNSNQPKFSFSGVGYDSFGGGGVVIITGTIIVYEDYTFKSATRDTKAKLGTSTILFKDNTSAFTPTNDYHPATKKYVDDAVSGAAQINHYICTASTKNPGLLNFAVTHVRPTSERLLEIIEEGFTNIANGVNEGFVLDYSPNNNSVANWNNVTIHTNYIKPSDFTQTTSYELLAYTQRRAVIYLGVLTVNGTWSDNKFTCSSIEQPGMGAWTQFNFDLLLTKANTTEYTPTNDYHPATKKYVDDSINALDSDNATSVYHLKLSSTKPILTLNNTITSTVESELQEISNIITKSFSRKGFTLYVSTSAKDSYTRDPALFYINHNDLTSHPTRITGDGYKIYRNINHKYVTILQGYITINGKWTDDIFTATGITIGNGGVSTQVPLDTNVLTKDNTSSFTPSADYHPATKKYVDDSIASIDIPEGGSGDGYTYIHLDCSLLTVTSTTTMGYHPIYTLSFPDTDAANTIKQEFVNKWNETYNKLYDELGDLRKALNNIIVSLDNIPFISTQYRSIFGASILMTPLFTEVNGGELQLTSQSNLLPHNNVWTQQGELYNFTFACVRDGTFGETDGYRIRGVGGLQLCITTFPIGISASKLAEKTYVDNAIETAITTVLEGEY